MRKSGGVGASNACADASVSDDEPIRVFSYNYLEAA